MAKFPSNGATAGNDGQTDGDATGFLYCGMQAGANTPDTTIVTYPFVLTVRNDTPAKNTAELIALMAREGRI